jgi:hypothetical protein
MQKTRQLSVAMKKQDKVNVYVSNDIIVFERNRLGSKLLVDGFQIVWAHNWLQATNHSLGGYPRRERWSGNR